MSEIFKPLENSAAFDIHEAQTKALFLAVLKELYEERITDIYSYGTPAYANPIVLERFIKQIGLVVLRRPNTSHLIMRILYENWTSLASKRGLAFLEFALEMLWTDQWKIRRLWHSIPRSDEYPNLVTHIEQPYRFLTSRIYILLDSKIDQQELEALSPSLSRMVPANIVADIGVEIPLEDMHLGVACATDAVQVGYFVPVGL